MRSFGTSKMISWFAGRQVRFNVFDAAVARICLHARFDGFGETNTLGIHRFPLPTDQTRCSEHIVDLHVRLTSAVSCRAQEPFLQLQFNRSRLNSTLTLTKQLRGSHLRHSSSQLLKPFTFHVALLHVASGVCALMLLSAPNTCIIVLKLQMCIPSSWFV